MKWLYEKIEKVVEVGQFDSTEHKKNQEILKKNFEKNGYRVELEKLLIADYKNYKLGHYYDLVATIENEEKEKIVIEVKPEDMDYYIPQYLTAQAILRLNRIRYKYYVYEYNTQKMINKNNFDNRMIVEFLNSKIKILHYDAPALKMGNDCYYCQFAQCINHPRHEQNQKENKNRENEVKSC